MTTPFPQPSPPHVLIVGGGLAGLAAASALVDRGLRLTIVEAGRWADATARSMTP